MLLLAGVNIMDENYLFWCTKSDEEKEWQDYGLSAIQKGQKHFEVQATVLRRP